MTCAFFKSSTLHDRLQELNRRLKNISPKEVIEFLTPQLFKTLLKQKEYDVGVKLKSVSLTNGKYTIEDKHQQSTSQFASNDTLENFDEESELLAENKSTKPTKVENFFDSKEKLSEALNKQTLAQLMTKLLIAAITLLLLGIIAIYLAEYIRFMRPIKELKNSFTMIDFSARKTSEISAIKYQIHQLLVLNAYF